jgi:pimeloyl-ACP methyl ester carboxylesterase
VKTTYVRLTNNSNALLQEPVTPDPVRRRIVVLVAHPEGANQFNSFIAREVTRRGYRAMMLNYYGPETTYEEFLAPIAAAITHLRGLPGVQKVVVAGHSTGGPELTFYQDVAENGPRACQDKVYPCASKNLTNLPKADGVMLLDSNNGASERTIAMDPAVDSRRPRERNPELDMFSPRNGFNPATKSATYDPEFTRKFLVAQGARNNRVIDEALARLAKIEKGEGDYKDDEPFVVPGSAQAMNGAQLRLADTRLLSKTKAAHKHLKADGTTPVEIIPSVLEPRADVDSLHTLADTTQNWTVRHYLSFLALRTTADYGMTENDVTGIQWRSTPNSVPGNLEGITVPTLVMVGTCAGHVVLDEIGFHRSAARDKEFVGVEGGDHSFRPCKPQYGDSEKRAFDYVDGWLMKAGRF